VDQARGTDVAASAKQAANEVTHVVLFFPGFPKVPSLAVDVKEHIFILLI
jgi:hypothetical protein